MARLVLSTCLLLVGHALRASADVAPCASADAPSCGRLEGDHVLLQVEHHRALTRQRQRAACAGGHCTVHQATVTHHEEQQQEVAVHGAGGPRVRVSGRQILVDGQPLHIKGICWSPTPRGQRNRADFRGFLDGDLRLMQQAGINAIRLYGTNPATDRGVMDAIQAAGMWVVPTVYSWGGEDPSQVIAKVNSAKDHPAVLMWSIANEWNYNGIYVHMSHGEAVARINEVARLIKQADPSRPVSSVYGEVPSSETLTAMPDIDVWGINSYRGISFGDLMAEWAGRSTKPMYIGEFGADAYNARSRATDEDSQAEAATVLTQELVTASAAQGGVCSGGFLFEFADEWWKDGAGSAWVHDVGGVAPGGGPYPDRTFNEEWWGLVDLDRTPRKAFHAYAEVANPNLAPAP